MHPDEAAKVAADAKAGGAPSHALDEALANHPERVRVAQIGHEHVAAFVLTELEGGVEEISALSLSEVGMRAGAERAVVEYVVSAAKFGGRRAVEVLAPEGSAEARHLLAEGFRAGAKTGAGLVRFRIDLNKPKAAKRASAGPSKSPRSRKGA